MRHVVERAAHRRDEPFDLVEHRVEQRRQLVDRVVGARPTRHALVGAAGADDALHRLRSAGGSARAPTASRASRRSSAMTTIDSVTMPSAARNRASRSSRASVLFPTCTSVPSAEPERRRSRACDGSQPSGWLSTIASTPRSTTRTNSRSGAVCCSARTVVGERARPPRWYAAAYSPSLRSMIWRSRCASDADVRQ